MLCDTCNCSALFKFILKADSITTLLKLQLLTLNYPSNTIILVESSVINDLCRCIKLESVNKNI